MVRFTSWVLAFAACLPAATAHPANGPRSSTFGCGTEPSAEFIAKSEEFAALEANSSNTTANFRTAATITVPVYFHVVAKSTAASDGYIPEASLTAQLDVMNSNYGNSGVAFRPVGI